MESRAVSFAHLHVHSPFSFLDGATTIPHLVRRASELGMPALALTDHNMVAGAVRHLKACEQSGIQPILGSEVTLDDGSHLTLLAQNASGYANLCRLLTRSHLDHERGSPSLAWKALDANTQDLICLTGCRRGALSRAVARRDEPGAGNIIGRLLGLFGRERLFVELQRTGLPGDRMVDAALRELARRHCLPVVATNNVHHLAPDDFRTHDILTCIRVGCRIDEPHPDRNINAERYLKPPDEMERAFNDCPEAVRNTLRIASMCETYSLGGRAYMPRYPGLYSGQDAPRVLTMKVYAGARERYGTLSDALRARIEHELQTIIALDFAEYFLIFTDVVDVAKQKGIRFAGRGSAADSVVAYCLYLTNVDAFGRNHRFERFISHERAHSLPDVDLDFDARYRERIADYVLETYGQDHAAAVAAFHCYRARGTVRDVGKVFGFRESELHVLAKRIPMFASADDIEALLDRYPEVRALNIPRKRFELLFDLCGRIAEHPRHILTHASGIIVTGPPIAEIAPLQESAKGCNIIPFDKVDVEDMGLVKFDFLHLRMLGAVEDTMRHMERIAVLNDTEPLVFERIPLDDAKTYRLVQTGETAGAFQIESPAQRVLQSRLMASTIEDIVHSVAAIRPGPLKGEMVEPWVRRKLGIQPVDYLLPELRPILERTYGVVLFQEQVIDICVAIAGFTPGEADILRRAMTHKRTREEMENLGKMFVSKTIARGYSQETAETIFEWVSAYGGYGFCEGHAAAFGDTAYRTAYLLTHHPAEFYCGLLNNQPMGCWPPYILVTEAKRRGIDILPLDVNLSRDEFTSSDRWIRTGWRATRKLREETRDRMAEERHRRDFESVVDFAARVRPARDELENLVMAGAFERLHPNRRALLWALAEGRIPVAGDDPLGLGTPVLSLPHVEPFSDRALCTIEFRSLGFSPNWHPLDFLRESLDAQGVLTCMEAKRKEGCVRVAGVPVQPHRPPTRSGKVVVFLTLSDETGLLDTTVFDRVYQRSGAVLFTEGIVIIEGRMTRDRGLSLIAERICSALR
ncbi:DNA polymerase III subunit alpha [Candidatus Poribacteria bacterium]|nr:DNA polymerase III subunit alpha [Candidatus Poribacteria bacterium]